MKFDNELQEEVHNYFVQRDDFYFHGYTGTIFFATWPIYEEQFPVKSKKPISDKDNISATIYIYSNNYPDNAQYGVEMKIEMHLWGFGTDEIMFQGWVESIEELEIICKSVGL